ncbi:MAG: hypothetical protein V4538_16375 [Bacteroidota bacterium]
MINELSHQIYANAKSKGFFEEEKNTGEMLCLIHSEISEALNADNENKYCDLAGFFERLNQISFSYNDGTTKIKEEDFIILFESRIKNTFEDEIADSLMRLMSLAAYRGINIEQHIQLKMRYNLTRPYKHGKKY